MHDIWNPWHGCKKISEGCKNCYMYYLDKVRADKDGSIIYKTKNFNYPLSKDRKGMYKIKMGEQLRVCMNSDFFLKEADAWREEAWQIIKKRSDVIFFLLTKRPERVIDNLPDDWNDGYENVFFNVTCENQKRAEERVPILLKLPFKHKGIMCAPIISEISLEKYLKTGQIEQVVVGGENYGGTRVCNFDWIKKLRSECEKYNITFCFIETGTKFLKDGRLYTISNKEVQSKMAHLSKMNYKGKDIDFKLYDPFGNLLKTNQLYKKKFRERCQTCGSRLICNGCSNCGKCDK